MKPGGCNGRIVTLIVQVKDSYGATSVCGGTSHPENIHACPTAEVLPFPDGVQELMKDLQNAKDSITGGSNAVSSSELLAQTMAIKTAFGDDCAVPVSLGCIRSQLVRHGNLLISSCPFLQAILVNCHTRCLLCLVSNVELLARGHRLYRWHRMRV